MMRMTVIIALIALMSGCASNDKPADVEVTTLANGAILRRYATRPGLPSWTLHSLTQIGGDESRLETVFGNVRGLELAADGSILVLDYQANEVRRFSETGEYEATLVRGGKGPGEIGSANGTNADQSETGRQLDSVRVGSYETRSIVVETRSCRRIMRRSITCWSMTRVVCGSAPERPMAASRTTCFRPMASTSPMPRPTSTSRRTTCRASAVIVSSPS